MHLSVIRPDYFHPVFLRNEDRNEIFLIEYDGFIKNKSEGLIQTMLKSKEKWIEKYPNLSQFEDMTREEIFEHTSILNPQPMMKWLSNNTLDDETIDEDILTIEEFIDVDEQCITLFEFALSQLLLEDMIEKCYILKSTKFYKNEINYIKEAYAQSLNKIVLVNGGLLTLFENENPTTVFLNDTALLLGHIITEYTDNQLRSKMFILRNTNENLEFDEESNMFTYLYTDVIKELNNRQVYGIGRMYTIIAKEDSPEENLDILEEE